MDQLVPSAAHELHAPVGLLQDLPEDGPHDIAVKADLTALAACSPGQGGKGGQSLPRLLAGVQAGPDLPDAGQDRPVIVQQGFQVRTGCLRLPVLLGCGLQLPLQCGQVHPVLPRRPGLQVFDGLPGVPLGVAVAVQRGPLRVEPGLAVCLPHGSQSLDHRSLGMEICLL